MILEIKKYPHPILRKKCQENGEVRVKEKELVQNMLKTIYN